MTPLEILVGILWGIYPVIHMILLDCSDSTKEEER